jgi:apolipoprotein N-acyltransferase
MVRSTPTGISALIDAYGRPVAQLGQSVEGVIDVNLPSPAPKTAYYVAGDWLFWVVILLVIVHSMASSQRYWRGRLGRWLGWAVSYRATPNVNGA